MVLTAGIRTFRVAWGDGTRELRIPADRITAELKLTDLPPIADPAAALLRALDNPIGKPPLREIVKPGDRVALITGDRVTDRMLGSRDGLGHLVLDYLNEAGVPDQNVTLVFAPGMHPHRDIDEKLGPKLIGRVGRYVRHNPEDDSELVFRGYTTLGTPVWINRHVAEADVVVGFGEVSPGSHGGWTGGGKIILPGVAGRATIEQNHRMLMSSRTILGLADSNPMRPDMEEAADLAPLAFKVDVLVDSHERLVDVYSGDFRLEHRAALPKAREIWMTRMAPTDICVTHPGQGRERSLGASFSMSFTAAHLATKPDGIILLCLSAVDGYAVKGRDLPYNAEKTGRDVLRMRSEEIARDLVFARGDMRTGSLQFAVRRILETKRVYLVCDGIEPEEAAGYGFAATFRSFDEALERALAERGASATISVAFPRGPYSDWRCLPWREG
jgi:lactate racemase